MSKRIVGLLAVTLGVACEEDRILVLPQPEVQVDELKQKNAAQVDILWVVDNSPTMIEEQQKLADNFKTFITELTVCQGGMGADDLCDFATSKCVLSGAACNPPDYHIGVISTDVYAAFDQGKLRKVGLCVPAAGATPASGKFRYCAGDNRHCGPDPMDPAADAANTFCDMSQAIGFVTPTTPGAQNAFARAVRVGTAGSGNENGIRAAAMALGRDTDRMSGMFVPAPVENVGFLRDPASLFIIFVSDETDSSFGKTSYFYRTFEAVKGAGNEGLVSISAIVGDVDPDGEAGAERGGCPAAPAAPTAAAGDAYVALAMYTRGLTANFRVCDDKRLTCTADQTCKSPVENLPGICVPTTCQTAADCGNFKCSGQDCIACANTKCEIAGDRFMNVLSDNGVFGSICSEQYKDVLEPLGFEAAGLKRKFGLTKKPDCTRFVACNGVDVPMCVTVGGVVIPQGRAMNGWVYEPGSNSIFFDGASYVPPPGATITVSYRASQTDSALTCEGIQ